MTSKRRVSLALPLLLVVLIGCHSDAPKPLSVRTPAAANTQPKLQGCDAITDPAAAEDCRFRAEVLRKRDKSTAAPVVKHTPSTIQQP